MTTEDRRMLNEHLRCMGEASRDAVEQLCKNEAEDALDALADAVAHIVAAIEIIAREATS